MLFTWEIIFKHKLLLGFACAHCAWSPEPGPLSVYPNSKRDSSRSRGTEIEGKSSSIKFIAADEQLRDCFASFFPREPFDPDLRHRDRQSHGVSQRRSVVICAAVCRWPCASLPITRSLSSREPVELGWDRSALQIKTFRSGERNEFDFNSFNHFWISLHAWHGMAVVRCF